MIQPLFALTEVHGEVALAVGSGMSAAIVALWKRAQVIQDKQAARDDANLARVIDVVERVTKALDENTAALKEASRAQ